MKTDSHAGQDRLALRRWAESQVQKSGPGGAHSLAKEDARRLVHELQVHQVELELQNEELSQARDALEEARDQYRDLYDRAPAGYLTLDAKGIIRRANLSMARMLATDRDHLVDQSLHRFVEQEQRGVLLRCLDSVAESGAQQSIEADLLKMDGARLPAQLEISTLSGEEGPTRLFRVVVVDIARLKEAESQLRQANERLEEEVRFRTADLVATNQALEEEIKRRTEAGRELLRQKTELEFKTKELEQANVAVGVLLRRSVKDRQAMETNVTQQVHNLVAPCLQDLLSTRLNPAQRTGIETALTHLDHITSSFAKRLGSPILGLTSREIQVAGMINQGLSSKEIAENLNLSLDTVSFHRRNIRRKLRITDTSANLATHLRKFS